MLKITGRKKNRRTKIMSKMLILGSEMFKPEILALKELLEHPLNGHDVKVSIIHDQEKEGEAQRNIEQEESEQMMANCKWAYKVYILNKNGYMGKTVREGVSWCIDSGPPIIFYNNPSFHKPTPEAVERMRKILDQLAKEEDNV
jgi:hypothetical protein